MSSYTLKLAENLGKPGNTNLCILDLGCGNGLAVYNLLQSGFDAYGVDLRFKSGEHVSELADSRRIRLIETDGNYRLPFDENQFDIVYSEQVLEHVQDQSAVASEISRVLKSDGLSIHRFPSRWSPIESHVFVPFSSVIRFYPWIVFWTALGFHKPEQKDLGTLEVARMNLDFLNKNTNYLGRQQIFQVFSEYFFDVRDGSREYLKISPNRRGRLLSRAAEAVPWLYYIYESFGSRTLVLQNPKKC